MLRDLVLANRSYRRFRQDRQITEQDLRELVDLGRLSASAANLQPTKYILSCTPEKNALIFPTLAWAGYLTEWGGPADGERPTAYVILLLDTNISESHACDHAIAAQSILLGAAERGIGGCMIGSIEREQLTKLLNIPKSLEILMVLAMGYPSEKVVLEEAQVDGSIKYYRDKQDVHRVPKRKLEEVILDL